MSDDEDFDIAGSLGLNQEEEEDYSSSDNESEQEIQDEIISSDEEEQADEPPKKKTKPTKKQESFPSLELSDNEQDREDADDDSQLNSYFIANNPATKKAKAGSFASFGLSKFLLTNIAKKGFRQPTPIQRKTIPLVMENRDVVGMARTGSGKTAAFVLPLIEKLKVRSASGVRAIILSPSRELALQTYKQVKEFGHGTNLQTTVLIGGDTLEEDFSKMVSKPDIIVCTPGRFLHLKVEMDYDLSTIQYIVFDEADRLFEMGFAIQLNELLASLPPNRQSLLFSATLPRSLVDFAKAGLTNPVLVRLDAETKISDQLQMAYFTTKKNEREANLLYILQEVIKLPLGSPEQIKKLKDMDKRQVESDEENEEDGKKKKYKFKKERMPAANQLPSEFSTIVFVPTKHHVEYVTRMLRDAGYLVSYIYGTLDQHARKNQLYQFRIGLTHIMVVTDVAARGIDIPVLANVINFTLPGSSKIFIHRVGRTARAGNKGWAYSIVNEKELPYLLDLELFLGKKILLTSMHETKCEVLKRKQGDAYVPPKVNYTERLVLGSIPRLDLEGCQELYENLLRNDYELKVLRDVAAKGEKLYHRTRQAASPESLKRSKEIMETGSWDEQHVLFGPNLEKQKQDFLAKLQNRNVKETVFEFNKKGNDKDENSLVEFMHRRRRQIAPIQRRAKERRELLQKERNAGLTHGIEDEILHEEGETGYNADEQELEQVFEDADKISSKKKTYRDPNFFLSHYAPASVIQDQQLSISSSFANDAQAATFDLDNDDKIQKNKQTMAWDKKKGKYVNSKSTDVKYIIGESGQKIPATFRSGKFDEWKKKRGANLTTESTGESDNKRFKHKKVQTPKLPDKFRDDYHKQKKKVEKAVEGGMKVRGYNKPGHQQEIKSTEQIRKARMVKEQRRAKNARPSRRK
ncbi:ATP-dependent RNA helicase DBP10 [Spathaspora passalidarum NRRL Y-27907]|uniref:ATP-dependent RNA helicase DBP10 n=1 Tax=Spathaspora passalidarum (strain NRRL Y-27907 / 11-Y1) TaxID=619300 RepID=G3ARW0_SPAPN|nr:ATP-dependent RNA helicase DBP10 [Spathaspora passalidarum NRRL Y-27907]EGW31377.1 ATP-dependent RNA helicase DBP10 [Spathaspora passalidarum NRRL Y-27907]